MREPSNYLRLKEARLQGPVQPAAEAFRTAEDGYFEVRVPETGIWRVRVHADGHVPMESAALAITSRVDLAPLTLEADAGTRIRVLSHRGEPVEKIWIHARSAPPGMPPGSRQEGWFPAPRLGRTGDDGVLLLPRSADETLEVTAFGAGAGRSSKKPVRGEAVLSLRRPFSDLHEILVVEAEGQPVPAALVASGNPAWPVGVTDEEGRAFLQEAASERLDLHILTADGRRWQGSLPGRESEGASEASRIVYPRLESVRGQVSSRGTDTTIPGALVWPRHDPGTFVLADAEGRFVLPLPPYERFSVLAAAEGFLEESIRLQRRSGGLSPRLALTPSAKVFGIASNGQGDPLPGALLEVTEEPAGEVAARAWSDSDGNFVLPRLRVDGRYRLSATKSGHTPSLMDIPAASLEGRRPLRAVLRRSRPGIGRVVDLKDRPVPGAEVWVSVFGREAEGAEEEPPWITDQDGVFRVPELPGLDLSLEARAPGFSPLEVRGINLADESSSRSSVVDLGTLILEPGAELSGRVRDPEGRPVAFAELRIRDAQQARRGAPGAAFRGVSPVAHSDRQGRFRIADLEAGRRLLLEARHEDYLPTLLRDVEAPSEEPLEIALDPAAGIRGRVITTEGQPVAGASVGVSPAPLEVGVVAPTGRRQEMSRGVTADDDGFFHFRGLVPGDLEIRANAEGFRPAVPRQVSIAPRQELKGLELVLEVGAVLEGALHGEDGESVAQARVQLAGQRTASDAEGRFRLEGLPLGLARVRVEHPKYERLDQQLFIEAGKNLVELSLSRGLTVAGRALDAGGEAVPGARVTLEGQNWRDPRRFDALTEENGRFAFFGVVPGAYDLEARAPGFAATRKENLLRVQDESIDGIEVILEGGSTVFGRIVGLDFEELMGTEVFAEDGATTHRGVVDHEGFYEVSDLGLGSWELKASVSGGRRETTRRLAVEEGGQRLERDLVFDGVSLTGVVTYDGQPLPETSIRVTGRGIAAERTVVTDYQGAFEMLDLPPASYLLSVSNPRELLNHSREVSVLGHRSVRIDLESAAVSGRVVSSDGSETLGEAVVIFSQLLAGGKVGSMVSLVTGDDGRFQVARLTPGPYRLEGRRDGYAPKEQILEIRAGEDREGVELALDPTEGVDLVVRLASGRAPESLLLNVFGSDGRRVFSELRVGLQGGRVRFPTVPPGSWTLLLSTPGGAATRTAATVPGPPVEVTLPDAGRLRVQVRALAESNLLATLKVTDDSGARFEAVDDFGQPTAQWTLTGGAAVVEDIPAGNWRLQVVSSDGQVWQGRATTTGAPWSEVEL